jgi:hypothetical protein
VTKERNRVGEGLVSRFVSTLRPQEYQWRPYFPDLLNQPRLLIVREPGKLIAVYTYILRRRMTWQLALAALEDLFEVKISLGEKTIVVGIALGTSTRDDETGDMFGLLHNTFDTFLEANDSSSGELEQRLPKTIIDSTVKAELSPLWNAEREYIQASLKQFNERRFRDLVNREHKSTFERGALVPFADSALREFGFEELEIEPLVVSVKTALGNLKGMHRLRFDFRIPGEPATLIEVIQSGRYQSREKLRYLMTKARLTRYIVGVREIERLYQTPRLILFLDGNLAGPDHDPFRYIRALLSVGWTIIRVDQLDLFPRMLGRAHV